jgi:hypothetical protein
MQNVLFVDSRLDFDTSEVSESTRVVRIAPDEDGVAVISQVLSQHGELASVQVLGHGSAGSLSLGSVDLSDATLARYESAVRDWGAALSEDGDLLLFGCDVAAGESGRTFVSRIAELTGADVAASDDLTGNAARGGDWDLEYRTGAIEAVAALSLETLAEFEGVLVSAPNESTLRSLITSGASEIELTADISLTGGLPVINSGQNIKIDGQGFKIDGNDAHQIFLIKGGSLSLVNVTLEDGYVRGGNGSGGGGGGLGAGGAIFLNNGTLVADNVTFSSNSAVGGSGSRAPGANIYDHKPGYGGGSGGDLNASAGGFLNSGGNGGKAGDIAIDGRLPAQSKQHGKNGSFGGGGGGGGSGGGDDDGGSDGGRDGGDGGDGGFGAGGGGGAEGGKDDGDEGDPDHGYGGSRGIGGQHAGNGTSGDTWGGDGGMGGGGAGLGGALFVKSGTAYLISSTFENNSTTGGTGAQALADDVYRYGGSVLQLNSSIGDSYGTIGTLSKKDVTISVVGGDLTEDGDEVTIEIGFVSGTFEADVPVSYSLGGDAVEGSDYLVKDSDGETLSGLIAIPAGSNSTTLTLVPQDDTDYDPAEEIIFSLAAGSLYDLSGTTSKTIAVVDNEPTIDISPNTTITEGDSHTFTIALDKPAPHDFVIPYTLGGTATEGNDADYAPLAKTLSIAEGKTSKTITVNTVDDTELEPDETVIVTLGNSSNGDKKDYNLGTASATLTIEDNEIPPVATIASVVQPTEGSTKAKFRVQLGSNALGNETSGAQTGTFFSYIVTAGTATEGDDYQDANTTAGKVFIPDTASSAEVEIDILDDLIYEEGGETFSVELVNHDTNADLYELGTTTTVDFTIAEDDVIPTATLAKVSDPLEAGEVLGKFNVNLSSASLKKTDAATETIIDYEVVADNSTATTDDDYVALSGSVAIPAGETRGEVEIVPIDDALYDPGETIEIRLKNPSNGELYTTGGAPIQFTIGENDDLYTASIAKSLDANEDGTLGAYRVSIDKAAHADLEVVYTIAASSDAESGTDFTPISGRTTIAAGQTSAVIQVQAQDNQIDEGDRALTLDLEIRDPYDTSNPNYLDVSANREIPSRSVAPDNNYTIGTASATILVQDDDTAGIRLTRLGNVTNEKGTTAEIEVRLETRPTADVTVTLTSTDGSEALMLDGATEAASASVTFTPDEWQTAKNLTVKGIDDAIEDGEQTYSVVSSITSDDTAYSILGAQSVSLTNLDDDGYGLLVDTPNQGSEGAGAMTYAIALTKTPSEPIPVEIYADEQTKVSADGVTFASSVIVNLADTTTKTIAVQVIDDTDVEGLHSSTIGHRVLDHNDPFYAKQTELTPAVLTLNDNDAPLVGILKAEAASEESVIAGRFAIALDQPAPAGGITVDYTVTAGNATAGADYTNLKGSVFVKEGSTGADITVNPIQDAIVETGGEDITVTIDGGTGYNVDAASASKTVTIFDDDQAGVRIRQSGNSSRIREGLAGDSYTVELTSQPSDPVTVTLNTSGEVNPSQTTLTFTAANWNSPQTVALPQIDNQEADGDRTQTITHTVTSADTNYDGLAADAVTIDIIDNDIPGIKVEQSSFVTQVTENGATDTYTIVLESQPASDVTIELTSSANAIANPFTGEPELSFNQNSLTFTRANWDQKQTVTVTAVNDDIDLDDRQAAIVQAVTSADPNYNGFELVDIPVDIREDDEFGIIARGTGSQNYVIEGSDNPDFIEIEFATQPIADVTITFNTGSDLEAIPDLVITPDNWDSAFSIPVFALRDDDLEVIEFPDLGFTFTSADPNYNGYIVEPLPFQVVDTQLVGTEVAAGLASILDQIDALLDTQLDAVELPLIGSLGQYAPDYIGTFRDLLVADVAELGQATADELGATIEESIQTSFDNAGLDIDVAVAIGVALDELTFDIAIGSSDSGTVDLSADLGLPALGLKVDGQANAGFEYELGLGMGWHEDFGFYVNTETTGFKANAGVDLSDDFKAEGNLGFFRLEGANNPENPTQAGAELSFVLNDLDNTPQVQFLDADGSGVWEPGEPIVEQKPDKSYPELPILGRFDTNSNGQYDADEGSIIEQAAPDDGERLTLTELTHDFEFGELFNPTFNAGANLGLNVVTSAKGSNVLPQYLFDINVDWNALSYENGNFTGPQTPDVSFDNLQLDLGSFATNFAKPVFGKVNEVIDPLRPVLDFLQDDIKFFDNLASLGINGVKGVDFNQDGQGGVSLLDLAEAIQEAFSSSDSKNKINVTPYINAIKTTATLSELINDLAETKGNYIIDQGDFEIDLPSLGEGFSVPSFDDFKSSDITTSLRNFKFSLSNFSLDDFSLGLADMFGSSSDNDSSFTWPDLSWSDFSGGLKKIFSSTTSRARLDFDWSDISITDFLAQFNVSGGASLSLNSIIGSTGVTLRDFAAGLSDLFGSTTSQDSTNSTSSRSSINWSKFSLDDFANALQALSLGNAKSYASNLNLDNLSLKDLSGAFSFLFSTSSGSGSGSSFDFDLPTLSIPKFQPPNIETQINIPSGKDFLASIKNDATIDFPFLTDPMVAIDLLLGKEDVTLFTYDLPPLELGVGFDADILIYPAPTIWADFGGSLGASLDLAFGFDTQGLYDWANTGYALEAAFLPLDGFYVSDTENPDGTGEDVAEFTANLGVELGLNAGLNVAVAKLAGYARGGLEGVLDIDFRDSGESSGTADGKIRALSEVGANILQPWQLFNLYGVLMASASIGIEAELLGVSKTLLEKDFGPYKLLEIEYGENGIVFATAFDGPIASADVFFDTNFNGIHEANEPFTKTLSDGQYNLAVPLEVYDSNGNGKIDLSEGQIVVKDGVDTDTYQDQRFAFYSSPEWDVASPLTLLALRLEQPDPATVETQIETALGLPSNFNLYEDSALAGIEAGNSSAATVFRKQAQLQTFLILGANSLGGEGDRKTAALSLINEVVIRIQAGESIALDNVDQLRGIIESTAGKLGVTPFELDFALEELTYLSGEIASVSGSGSTARSAIASQIPYNVADSSYLDLLEDPWTSLLRAAVPTPDMETAKAKVNDALGLPRSLDIATFNPIAEIEQGSLRGLEVYVKQVQLNATWTQLADIAAGFDIEDAENTVIDRFLVQLEAGTSFEDMGDPATIEALVKDLAPRINTERLEVAVRLIAKRNANMNALLEAARSNGDVQAARLDIADEQRLAQGIQSQLLQAMVLGEIDPSKVEELIALNQELTINMVIENIIDGTEGDDTIVGTKRNDMITGFAGNDLIDGAGGDDLIFGNAGNDTIDGGDGNDAISAGRDDDIITGGAGIDNIFGNKGDDQIDGGDDTDLLYGGQGNDTVRGGAGDDQMFGDKGDDLLEGGDGDDVMLGSDGNDSLYGNNGDDLAFGNIGFDLLVGGDGNDSLSAGKDDDIVNGDAGDDYVFGNIGNDIVHGGDGNDVIHGGQNEDNLIGGGGDDTLSGDRGVDTLTGETGADIFQFRSGHDGDIITDFAIGEDKIELLGFEGVAIEAPETGINAGIEAIAFEQIQFANINGNLSVSINGEQIVTLNGITGLSPTDFVGLAV